MEAMDGPNWENDTLWLSEDPIDSWFGVATDSGGLITHLELSANGLSGQMPRELGSLDNLLQLDLSWNQISGPIPPDVGQLQDLRLLYLEGNLLSGSVPPELANLENLRVLHIYGNSPSGQVPQDLLGRMENLTWLSLDGNRFTGCVPSGFRDRLTGPVGTVRGLPFCDEVPEPRPCEVEMILQPGEYCTLDTRLC